MYFLQWVIANLKVLIVLQKSLNILEPDKKFVNVYLFLVTSEVS